MGWRLRIPSLICFDAILINFAIIISYLVRFDGNITKPYWTNLFKLSIIATLIFLVIFYICKLYHRIWAYASTGELMTVLKSVTLGSLAVTFITYMTKFPVPRSIILLFWAFGIIFVGGSRFAWRIFVESRHHGKYPVVKNKKRILIYGAGDAGALVAREYKSHYNGSQPVIGFIDDDPKKHHLTIHGLPVLGGRENIPSLVCNYSVDEIIIAMPSVPRNSIREIVNYCKEYVASIKILPGVYQLLDGKVTINQIRPVEIEDLLGREPVRTNLKEISRYLKNKVVLVTGAGGSIGSELCRQIARVGPKKLVLLGHGENSIHKIWLELSEKFPELPLKVEIADVRDKPKLEIVFAQNKPDVVFHAAAHKHVPLMEMHPDEAVKTNVFGTKNVAEMADRSHCEIFVLISTDKAVNPSSVMGATKRMAELIIQNLFKGSDTKFVAVRFGNVLGSRGSVVPIFKEQIAKGGPVTVTHPEMTRYFMTIPEAVQLVIQAGAMAKGGEVFLLDMGEPVKIVDLATNLIKLSGFKPGEDIEIKFTGIRPGEKLFEELLTAEEGATSTRHKRIFVAKPAEIDYATLISELLELSKKQIVDGNEVFRCLQKMMPKLIHYRQEKVG
ncbi:nucleoside-diphosphate sugar epimerase/dehydratase [Desulfotomaculum nigrificans]|uniref:polysaccharide biosynthesis protein n=1 Tax=Desulfotomaculum nigrificans TaxID=1565 RepID=UPI0001FAE939|nr:nucleoside-diphosphate sugar epimerase/dehydratase [Desulfotomaculum nigrificans]